jgi:hypothetical protein
MYDFLKFSALLLYLIISSALKGDGRKRVFELVKVGL